MYENGGNTTHRFLDGHPQMFVYPYESQLGTKHVNDYLTSVYPQKYRWPELLLDATPTQDYHAIIDEETKIRTKTPFVSKFREHRFEMTDPDRLNSYLKYVKKNGRSRGGNVEAFFRSTFDTWKDYKKTGNQRVFVGYSPVIVVDTEKILSDLPNAHVLHIVRNPWSAYADTKKRAMPLSVNHYMTGWTQNQHLALMFKKKYPRNMHMLRFEDIIVSPKNVLGRLCEKLGLEKTDTLAHPTWNGNAMSTVYPWGTIRKPAPAVNKATAQELSSQEQDTIRSLTAPYLELLDYKSFL
jgi:hypothetical protein